MQELFSHAYLFCLPSTLEGLPVALLEAMNYGIVVSPATFPKTLRLLRITATPSATATMKTYGECWRSFEASGKGPGEKGRGAAACEAELFLDRVTDQMEKLYMSLIRSRNS
jgi:glycosyltransferase involved in cell wall biosynthesis